MDEHKDKVLASRIDTITLTANKLTTARRVSPIPQLKCIGGSGCGRFDVQSMLCRAQGRGYNDNDIQWTCTAETGPYAKLGSTQVLCEGYDNPDGPYILKGSCGVEYRLILTEEGDARFPQRSVRHDSDAQTGAPHAGYLFFVLFAIVAIIIIHGIYTKWQENQQGGRRASLAIPPSLGDDDHDSDDSDDGPSRPLMDRYRDETPKDAPPPYTETADEASDTQNQGAGAALRRGLGYGAGAAAGVQATRLATNTYSNHVRAARSQDNSGEGSSGSYTTQRARQDAQGEIRPRIRRDSPPSIVRTVSNSSTQSNESTGFGGTTRR